MRFPPTYSGFGPAKRFTARSTISMRPASCPTGIILPFRFSFFRYFRYFRFFRRFFT
jgi:hypothetical protein